MWGLWDRREWFAYEIGLLTPFTFVILPTKRPYLFFHFSWRSSFNRYKSQYDRLPTYTNTEWTRIKLNFRYEYVCTYKFYISYTYRIGDVSALKFYFIFNIKAVLFLLSYTDFRWIVNFMDLNLGNWKLIYTSATFIYNRSLMYQNINIYCVKYLN